MLLIKPSFVLAKCLLDCAAICPQSEHSQETSFPPSQPGQTVILTSPSLPGVEELSHGENALTPDGSYHPPPAFLSHQT